MSIPKRVSSKLINALKGGVVPRVGIGHIAVGRTEEINALLHDVDIAEDGGAFFRFIVGRYGSGKSFLLQIMRQHAMERGFVTADVDLSPERRLMGSRSQGLSTYRELIHNLSVKTKPDGGALPLILEKWITSVRNEVISDGLAPSDESFNTEVEKKIYTKISSLHDMVHGFDFAKVINTYHMAYVTGSENEVDCVIKWLRGEYNTKSQAKQDLGVNSIITDDNWYDYIKVLTAFFVAAGYKGFIIMIDELVNIMKIPHRTMRQYNYEKILMMYNDILQGKAEHLGILMGGTPQAIEDPHRGIFSYEALKSRLEPSRFATDGIYDLLGPMIKIQQLTYEEFVVLSEKISKIHEELYGYTSSVTLDDRVRFVEKEFSRVGADELITPREMIRDFIELLNIKMKNPDKSLVELMGGDSGFAYTESEASKESSTEGYEDFEL